jgi:hypothetical protein
MTEDTQEGSGGDGPVGGPEPAIKRGGLRTPGVTSAERHGKRYPACQ